MEKSKNCKKMFSAVLTKIAVPSWTFHGHPWMSPGRRLFVRMPSSIVDVQWTAKGIHLGSGHNDSQRRAMGDCKNVHGRLRNVQFTTAAWVLLGQA